MKWLFFFLLLAPSVVFGQLKKFGFEGFYNYECLHFVVQQFAMKNDSVACKLPAQLLKPATKTVYVMKTPYLDTLPETAGGYNLRLADIEADAKMLYQEQRNNGAVILYVSDAMEKYSYWTVWAMPMKAVKKGRKYKVEYVDGLGAKVIFFYNSASAKFVFDRSECLNPPGLTQ